MFYGGGGVPSTDGGRFPRPRSSASHGSGGAAESACRTAAVLGFGASFFERLLNMANGSGGFGFARSASPIEKLPSSHQPSLMTLDVCSSQCGLLDWGDTELGINLILCVF